MTTFISAEWNPFASIISATSTHSFAKRKWKLAFNAIFCSRSFLDTITSSRFAPNNPTAKTLTASPSYVTLTVEPEIPQSTLTDIVRSKDLRKVEHLGGISGIASLLQTTLDSGIHGDDNEISRRKMTFGSNTYKKAPPKSFFFFIIEAFKDPTIVILLLCAALSLAFGIKEEGLQRGWYDGGSIVFAIILVIAVSSVSNYRQSRQFEKLSSISNDIQTEVVRGGKRTQVSIFDLVVGDVVCLKLGDQVPADGLFIDGHCLQLDFSSMTGESDHIEIDHQSNPFLVSGTKVVEGYGKMIITSVGMNTCWGELMSHISRDTTEQTPLQVRLNNLTAAIGKVGLAVAFVVLVVLFAQYFTGRTKNDLGKPAYIGKKTKSSDIISSVLKIVSSAVTIVVVAIPEGLPLAVTLTLAYSMKRMMSDNAMVRRLSSCETMGSVTTICTDKTGTLTMNLMKVSKFWSGHDLVGQNVPSLSPSVVKLIKEGVALNTTGEAYWVDSRGEYEFFGSPTEKAILSWAVQELRMDTNELRHQFEVLQVETFNSKKKMSGVMMRNKVDNTVHVHWKGAAEMITDRCTSFYDALGMRQHLDGNGREVFKKIIQDSAGLRCIAFAHCEVEEHEYKEGEIIGNELSLLGLVGIKDPCRPEVRKAVERCQDAGVNVKMITGDNVFTAKAIAMECGILKPGQSLSNDAVVEGEVFRSYTPEQRLEKVDRICIMARSSPMDKLLMVQCLKEKGGVVAVTGDGTNDAPALKEANIGLSMGTQGTEVAKESSDIVILDDNFASVATVLHWGRSVYNNVQKFIQFQLTVCVAALAINFVAAVSAGEVPLTAVQLLWVNLIMDTLGALALATERPTKELMEKSPVGREEPLITNVMWRNLLAQSAYQVCILLALQFRGESLFGVSKKVNRTLIFNTFVLCQIFNEFNARKLEKKNVFKGLHKDKLFLSIIGVTIVIQVIMVELLKKFAGTERLNWGQWAICVGLGSISWPIGWVVKCIPVPEKPFFSYFKRNAVYKCS